eukprot:5972332-Amphidinium_carterae.1
MHQCLMHQHAWSAATYANTRRLARSVSRQGSKQLMDPQKQEREQQKAAGKAAHSPINARIHGGGAA